VTQADGDWSDHSIWIGGLPIPDPAVDDVVVMHVVNWDTNQTVGLGRTVTVAAGGELYDWDGYMQTDGTLLVVSGGFFMLFASDSGTGDIIVQSGGGMEMYVYEWNTVGPTLTVQGTLNIGGDGGGVDSDIVELESSLAVDGGTVEFVYESTRLGLWSGANSQITAGGRLGTPDSVAWVLDVAEKLTVESGGIDLPESADGIGAELQLWVYGELEFRRREAAVESDGADLIDLARAYGFANGTTRIGA
jgi:hypothetical protein